MEGAEMAVQRRTEPARRGPEAAAAFRRSECKKAMESGQEASTCRCGAIGELGEGQEGAERRDDGEAERRRWRGLPVRRSGGVNARGWRRTSQEALVGSSGAGGARDCGHRAAEVGDGGEQDGGVALAKVVERRRKRGGKCGCVRRKKNRGGLLDMLQGQEESRASWSSCWRLRATAARRGGAGKKLAGVGRAAGGRAGGLGGAGRTTRGSW
jgi:hypothetical protein